MSCLKASHQDLIRPIYIFLVLLVYSLWLHRSRGRGVGKAEVADPIPGLDLVEGTGRGTAVPDPVLANVKTEPVSDEEDDVTMMSDEDDGE